MSIQRLSDEEVFAKDGFRCVYCGFNGQSFESWTFLQVDHFKPRALGGEYDKPENLVTSCIICNNMKGAFEFSSIEEAKGRIRQWRGQMRDFWENNVKHLVQ